jgi:molecular chaperone GrpE (heat shock protein)
MRKRQKPQEFAIVEQPHATGAAPAPGEHTPFQAAQQEAQRLEQRAIELEALVHKLETILAGLNAAKRKFLLDMIEDIMDNLDRSLEGVDETRVDGASQRWVKRFQRTRRKTIELLAKEQVVPIDLETAPPGLSVVNDVESRDDVPDGTVVAVNLRGYLWQGEILRKPEVVVARNTSADGVTARETADHGGNIHGESHRH